MAKLILMRHGKSLWNQLNLFTGWVDIPLSEEGIQEALDGGLLIKDEPIDIVFTSTLIRAQMTAMLALLHHSSGKVPVMVHERDEWDKIYSEKTLKETLPVISASELNERMYGELQGLNKQEMKEHYGEDQVQIWRRSFDVAPPGGESLKMTAERTLPYFEQAIVPCLKEGKNVFIAAHGNSLRSILMSIDNLSPEQVVGLEIATGFPMIYTFEEGRFTKLPAL